MKKRVKAVGLMSGTSADGIDAALVEITGSGQSKKITLIHHNRFPFPKDLSIRILDVSSPGHGTTEIVCHLNFVLGKKFAEAAIRLVKEAAMDIKDINLIGSHGQTICHIPREITGKKGKDPEFGYRTPSTLQIGEPSIIAETTGVTTVADFRPRDMAAGGEGAPLTPYAHFVLFGGEKKTVAVNNLGGISNVTYLPANGNVEDLVGFDTGPANILIDAMVCLITDCKKRFDLNGRLAGKGVANHRLLERMMKHPFLKKSPPKSTGREDFGSEYARSILGLATEMSLTKFDLMATVTRFTARSIAWSYEKFLKGKEIEKAIFCGGGVKNKTLMAMLKEELSPIAVETTERYNIPPEAVESISFALLAHATIAGEKNSIRSVTGAQHNAILGKIIPGKNGLEQ